MSLNRRDSAVSGSSVIRRN